MYETPKNGVSDFQQPFVNRELTSLNEQQVVREEGEKPIGINENATLNQNIYLEQNRSNVANNLGQMAIMKTNINGCNSELVVIKANWDTSDSSTSIIAEMHNVQLDELPNSWLGNGGDNFLVDTQNGQKLKSQNFTLPLESPRGSDSGIGRESPEGNFSWLIDFKLDTIPGLSNTDYFVQKSHKRAKLKHLDNYNKAPSPVYVTESRPIQYSTQQQVQNVNLMIDRPQSNSCTVGFSRKPDRANNLSGKSNDCRKPPFTYTELIEHALREKGQLTVSGIYQWISDHFSFYKANDDRWKNSVRHNLSINPHFRKGDKAVHGAGHLWTIAQKDDTKNMSSWNVRKQRIEQFMRNEANEQNNRIQQQEIELAVATASILPEHNTQNNIQHDLDNEQIQTANDIISGLRRNVEVQYIIPADNPMRMVSREQVAVECGLSECGLSEAQIQDTEVTQEDYFITDINPNTLEINSGLNISTAEIIATDELFTDEIGLNFHCYELPNNNEQ